QGVEENPRDDPRTGSPPGPHEGEPMNSDADKTWDRAIGKLRREKGFSALTPEEAKAAYESAPSVPLSAARISEIVKAATGGARERVTAEPSTWADWSRLFPLKEMRRLG